MLPRLGTTAIAAASAVGLYGFSEARKRGPAPIETKEREAAALIERAMAIKGIPGLAVAVSVDGRIVWEQGFGLADIETGAKCTARFAILP